MKRVRVLIVDDSPALLDLAHLAIRLGRDEELSRNEYKYEVIYAYNGVQGWEQANDALQ